MVEPLAAAAGLTAATVFGGVGQGPQVKALSRGVDILIACPGRLEDLIQQRHCDLRGVEITAWHRAMPGLHRGQQVLDGEEHLGAVTLGVVDHVAGAADDPPVDLGAVVGEQLQLTRPNDRVGR